MRRLGLIRKTQSETPQGKYQILQLHVGSEACNRIVLTPKSQAQHLSGQFQPMPEALADVTGSDIFNILGSLIQLRLHLHTTASQGLLAGSVTYRLDLVDSLELRYMSLWLLQPCIFHTC